VTPSEREESGVHGAVESQADEKEKIVGRKKKVRSKTMTQREPQGRNEQRNSKGSG